MDLSYSAEYEAFRAEVAGFLAGSWPLKGAEAELPSEQKAALFRGRAIEAGYLARSIPKRYGGSQQAPDVLKAQIIREEFFRARAPGDLAGIGPSMLVPTLLEKGAEWQKEKFIGPTMRGEIVWCQGYSEPGSGSDLASLQTRAEIVGNEWVINGQKIWTSGAHVADYMFCLCRTERDAPKHAGISYLLLAMKQPGIEVRPLRQMTGASDFNEVFFSDARTPLDWIVGKRGEGWIVSRTTLKHERNMIGDAATTVTMFQGLVSLAKRSLRDGRPALDDPGIRQRIVQLEGYVRSHQYSGYRQLTKAAKAQDPGRVGLMNKLMSTNLGQEMAKIALDLIGDDGLLEPTERRLGAPRENGQWVGQFLWSLGSAVAGGTANIQRNVIGERGLGLPRDAAAQRS
ncbi:MAG: acyl-CoA dehydrogenase [Deltaproteobacteria bacterium]|nr:acyl-CoA dehydrogenase [Deltaproteobacteria bacterium]